MGFSYLLLEVLESLFEACDLTRADLQSVYTRIICVSGFTQKGRGGSLTFGHAWLVLQSKGGLVLLALNHV